MELNETVNLMCSTDYKDRFRGEYYQLKIRTEKLKNMLEKWYSDELDFMPIAPIVLIENQYQTQRRLMMILEDRAIIEKITL